MSTHFHYLIHSMIKSFAIGYGRHGTRWEQLAIGESIAKIENRPWSVFRETYMDHAISNNSLISIIAQEPGVRHIVWT